MNTERLMELARFTAIVEPGPNVKVSISTEELKWLLDHTKEGRDVLDAVAVEFEGQSPMTADELRANSEPVDELQENSDPVDEEPS